MAPDPSTPDPRVIAAYLDDVDVELDAARRGLRPTADHNIEALVDELSADDSWRARLRVLEPLSAYATTYRYPSPTGKRKGGPR